MKLLLACEVSSPHTARWVNQLQGTGWDVHLFQVIAPGYGISPLLSFGMVHYPEKLAEKQKVTVFHTTGLDWKSAYEADYASGLRQHINYLYNLIKTVQPDLIHSHGLNINWHNLLEPVHNLLSTQPEFKTIPWLYSSWGTDLDCYAMFSAENRRAVSNQLAFCDYLTTECHRDLRLARMLGFSGEFCGFFPDFGGIQLNESSNCNLAPPSGRHLILLKGRDNAGTDGDPVGRAMTAIKSFELCRDALQDFSIVVTQATAKIREHVKRLNRSGIDIVAADHLAYSDLLRLYTEARIAISATVNDGLPSSLVEAMTYGAFPLFSNVESFCEWIRSGENGLIFPAEDPQQLAIYLDMALKDDQLVDKAAISNLQLVSERLEYNHVRSKVLELYRCVAVKGKQVGNHVRPRLGSAVLDHLSCWSLLPAIVSPPLFSILVPTYNQARFLPAALDSLLAQTVQEWEALVVDDGSTDETYKILAEYAAQDERFRVFSKPNGGTSSALNEGLRHVTGQWVCWLSSDDLFKPDKLAVHLAAIAEEPDCRFFHTDYELLFEDTGERIPQIRLPEDIPPIPLQRISFFEENLINGISVAVRRDLLNQAGRFNIAKRNGQDFDMWLRCHAYASSSHLSHVTSSTRVHPEQGTGISPLAGIYDSGRSCLELLNTKPFSALFPFLNLHANDAALSAIQKIMAIIANPVSIINLSGFGNALLAKMSEWISKDSTVDLRTHLSSKLPAIIKSIREFGCAEEVSEGLSTLENALSSSCTYYEQDWLTLLKAKAFRLEKIGRTADSNTIHDYLRLEERLKNIQSVDTIQPENMARDSICNILDSLKMAAASIKRESQIIRIYICRNGDDFSLPEHLCWPITSFIPSEAEALRYFQIVTNPAEAEYIFFPYYLTPMIQQMGVSATSALIRSILPDFVRNEHKYLFFNYEDISTPLGFNSIIFQISLNKTVHDINAIPYPYPVDDPLDGSLPDFEELLYQTSFVGYSGSHPVRQLLVDALSKRADLQMYIETTPLFHGHFNEDERRSRQESYCNIMRQSLTVLCPRGAAENSVRFFETMAFGRIPVLLADNAVLPLESLIRYDEFIIRVPESDAVKVGDYILAWLATRSSNQIKEACLKARTAWNNWLKTSRLPVLVAFELDLKRKNKISGAS